MNSWISKYIFLPLVVNNKKKYRLFLQPRFRFFRKRDDEIGDKKHTHIIMDKQTMHFKFFSSIFTIYKQVRLSTKMKNLVDESLGYFFHEVFF